MTISGALSRDTQVEWAPVQGAVRYRIHWRRDDVADWTQSKDVTETKALLTQVPVDDHFVGVSAIAADGRRAWSPLAVVNLRSMAEVKGCRPEGVERSGIPIIDPASLGAISPPGGTL